MREVEGNSQKLISKNVVSTKIFFFLINELPGPKGQEV